MHSSDDCKRCRAQSCGQVAASRLRQTLAPPCCRCAKSRTFWRGWRAPRLPCCTSESLRRRSVCSPTAHSPDSSRFVRCTAPWGNAC
eukprot:scaffold10067_cov67-Phaeocystis_antarctica.AAC.2